MPPAIPDNPFGFVFTPSRPSTEPDRGSGTPPMVGSSLQGDEDAVPSAGPQYLAPATGHTDSDDAGGNTLKRKREQKNITIVQQLPEEGVGQAPYHINRHNGASDATDDLPSTDDEQPPTKRQVPEVSKEWREVDDFLANLTQEIIKLLGRDPRPLISDLEAMLLDRDNAAWLPGTKESAGQGTMSVPDAAELSSKDLRSIEATDGEASSMDSLPRPLLVGPIAEVSNRGIGEMTRRRMNIMTAARGQRLFFYDDSARMSNVHRSGEIQPQLETPTLALAGNKGLSSFDGPQANVRLDNPKTIGVGIQVNLPPRSAYDAPEKQSSRANDHAGGRRAFSFDKVPGRNGNPSGVTVQKAELDQGRSKDVQERRDHIARRLEDVFRQNSAIKSKHQQNPRLAEFLKAQLSDFSSTSIKCLGMEKIQEHLVFLESIRDHCKKQGLALSATVDPIWNVEEFKALARTLHQTREALNLEHRQALRLRSRLIRQASFNSDQAQLRKEADRRKETQQRYPIRSLQNGTVYRLGQLGNEPARRSPVEGPYTQTTRPIKPTEEPIQSLQSHQNNARTIRNHRVIDLTADTERADQSHQLHDSVRPLRIAQVHVDGNVGQFDPNLTVSNQLSQEQRILALPTRSLLGLRQSPTGMAIEDFASSAIPDGHHHPAFSGNDIPPVVKLPGSRVPNPGLQE